MVTCSQRRPNTVPKKRLFLTSALFPVDPPSTQSQCFQVRVQLPAARSELSGMKFSARTPSRPILIPGTARSIDTWAEHVVRIWATAGDLDGRVTLSRHVEASQGSDATFKVIPPVHLLQWGVQVFQTIPASERPPLYSCVAHRRERAP